MTKRKIPLELMELAQKNNISAITVYKRVETGKYSLEEAVTRPVGGRNGFRYDDSEYYKRPKSNACTFYYYDDDYIRLTEQIKLAKISKSKFLCQAVEYYLDSLTKD